MTELEQFIQKFEELERTMTRGRWRPTTAYERDMGFGDVCAVDAMTPDMLTEAVRDTGLNGAHAHGIAHLKNSNPTVIAMLKAAIEGLRAYAGCCDGCTCGDGWSHDAAMETLAHLNTLAAEALGTNGDEHDT